MVCLEVELRGNTASVCVSGYGGGGGCVGRVCVCVCVCFKKECVCGGVAGGVFGLIPPWTSSE